MRILLTGPNGQIGWELQQAFPASWEVLPVGRNTLDLTDPAAIRRSIRKLKPDCVVNAAGHTAVDRAEHEPELARRVNAEAVGEVGREAARIGTAVLHFSTDYVFDGTKKSPYTPDDPPNPLNVYGRTKLEGERALMESGASFIIIRTGWVYGLRRRNFLLAILRKAREDPEIRVVNDQTGGPTWCRLVAHAAVRMIEHALSVDPGRRSFGRHNGIYHVACAGATTWYDFASRAIDRASIQPKPKIVPVSSTHYNAPARRPAYSVLDCQKAEDIFGIRLPKWDETLDDVLGENAAAVASSISSSGDAS